MSLGTVVELWRYPVKSMRGERLDRARVDGRIPGDREWGVFDATTGKLLSAKTVGLLLLARARLVGDHTAIELPGGATVIAGTAEADRSIGAWLARSVELRRADDAPATFDMELDDGEGDGPRAVRSITTRPRSLFDSRSTLHLISTGTLAALARDHGAAAGEVLRYRPNLVIAGLDDAAEDAWVGANVRIGALVANVRKRTERCVMVSRAQPGLDADRSLLRRLVARSQLQLGVYLDPRNVGEITVGDPVEPRDQTPAGGTGVLP